MKKGLLTKIQALLLLFFFLEGNNPRPCGFWGIVYRLSINTLHAVGIETLHLGSIYVKF